MSAAVVAASDATIILLILVVGVLFLLWVASLVALALDTISIGAKIVWFLALTVLAPIAIPVYFFSWRNRRAAAAAGS